MPETERVSLFLGSALKEAKENWERNKKIPELRIRRSSFNQS